VEKKFHLYDAGLIVGHDASDEAGVGADGRQQLGRVDGAGLDADKRNFWKKLM
jgi:hypothetical protein